MGVPGVANVAIWGQRDRQLQVQVDPAKLRGQGVTLGQVIETTGNALWVSPLTLPRGVDAGDRRLHRHAEPAAGHPAHLADHDAGGPGRGDRRRDTRRCRLGDVANVVEDHQPLIGDAVVNDGPGLLLVVEKFPGANTLEVTQGVEEALADLAPGPDRHRRSTRPLYPPGELHRERRRPTSAIALLVGIVLVALVLGVFFFSWRAAVIGIVAIPLSLVAAGLVLYVLGATANAMTVAGLVIAVVVVVDDAIVGIDQVMRRRGAPRADNDDDDEAVIALVLRSTLEVRRVLVYAGLIIGLALVPVFFVGGGAGAFLPTLAASYALAVFASMVVGADRHPGPRSDPFRRVRSRRPRLAAGPEGPGRLRRHPRVADPARATGRRHGGRRHPRAGDRARCCARPTVCRIAAAHVQGARSPDPFRRSSGHLSTGDEPDRGQGRPRAPGHPRGPQRGRPGGAGDHVRPDRRGSTPASCGSTSTRQPTTTRRSPRFER